MVGIDMKFMSNLSSLPINDSKKKSFEESFVDAKRSNLPGDDVLSYDRNRHGLHD